MRNSPTSVGSRAADTRSTVSVCFDHVQSRVASSFNFGVLLSVDYRSRARARQEGAAAASRFVPDGAAKKFPRGPPARAKMRPGEERRARPPALEMGSEPF